MRDLAFRHEDPLRDAVPERHCSASLVAGEPIGKIPATGVDGVDGCCSQTFRSSRSGSLTLLWTVRWLDHVYQAALQRLEHGACELRLLDGRASSTFVGRDYSTVLRRYSFHMPLEHTSPSANVIDVLDRVLDKGIVIDAWVRLSIVGINLIEVDARIVVASIQTYLQYADAVSQLAPIRPPLIRG